MWQFWSLAAATQVMCRNVTAQFSSLPKHTRRMASRVHAHKRGCLPTSRTVSYWSAFAHSLLSSDTCAYTLREIRGSASKRSTAWAQSHRPVPGIDCTGCFRKHESKAGQAWDVPTRLWGTDAGPVYTWYLDMLLVISSVWSAVTHGRKNTSPDLKEANFTFIDLVYQFVAN